MADYRRAQPDFPSESKVVADLIRRGLEQWREEQERRGLGAPAVTEPHLRRTTVYAKVSQAKREGTLTAPAHCEACGMSTKPHAHHEDYSRPLDVAWLCPSCHRDLHAASGNRVRGPEVELPISPLALRAARAYLGWSRGDLAARSGLSLATIRGIELARTDPLWSTWRRIVQTLQDAGIEFELTHEGVRRRQP